MSRRAERVHNALPKAWEQLAEHQELPDHELGQRLELLVTDDYLRIPRLSPSLRRELLGSSSRHHAQYFALATVVQELMLAEYRAEHPAKGPIVLVDMDGVIADYDGYTEAQIAHHLPAIGPLDRSLGPYIEHRLPADISDEDRQRVLAIQYAEHHFSRLPVIDGAPEAWKAMREWGYHPRICSSPLTQNLWTIRDKIAWLDTHWFEESADDAIIQKDKASQDGISLIDDMPAVREADRAVWQHVVFHTPANTHIATPYRLESWRDLATLERILADCALRYDAIRR